MKRNLISCINPKTPENATTEILAYLLEGFDTSRSAFMSLVDSTVNPADCDIITQHYCGQGFGNVDLLLRDHAGKWVVYVENKPWDDSVPTTIHEEGDQLKRYANSLKTEKEASKTLCLLATDNNKESLLHTVARVAGVSPDEITSHYANDGIRFIIITWEQIFGKIEPVFTDDNVPHFLIRELRDYLFPPALIISPEILQDEPQIMENWESVKTVVRQAKEILKHNDDISILAPSTGLRGYCLCGYFIKDNLNDVTFWFGAWLDLRRFFGSRDIRSLFGVQVRFQKEQRSFHNTRDGKSVIDPKVLDNCNFINDPPQRGSNQGFEYVFPLSNSSDEHSISAEDVANAVTELLKKINEALS